MNLEKDIKFFLGNPIKLKVECLKTYLMEHFVINPSGIDFFGAEFNFSGFSGLA